jgi:hypothetical protein
VDCTSQSINYSEEAGGGAAGLLEAYG